MKELIEIQNELKAPKSQYNSFGKYKYRKCEDILEAVKPLLKKHNCLLSLNDEVKEVGNYMYVESSSPNYPNVGPFSLTSECFDLSGLTNPSLSFYYNMYGAAMGTLNVYSNSSLVWSLSGNQGQGWNLVQIPLTSAGNTLIIEFEGTTGSSYTSDIAIDDINIIGLQQVNGCTDANAK